MTRTIASASGIVVGLLLVLAACGTVETADRVIIGDPDTIPAPNSTREVIEAPAQLPTAVPTPEPTQTPDPEPSAAPTSPPTALPSPVPTAVPTTVPATTAPSPVPSPRPAATATSAPAGPSDVADDSDGGESGDDSDATSTAVPQLSPLEAAVADLEARGQGVSMPNLVCHDLQRAQNILQALTDEFFATDTVDASGDDRRQVWDRNWVVTSHEPPAGERIVGDPLLQVLKDDESDCGAEPVPVMFDLTCLKVDLAQDLLQAQTGQFFASDLVDAAALDRTPILRGRWYVVGQNPGVGEEIVASTKPVLRVLHRDEAQVCVQDT